MLLAAAAAGHAPADSLSVDTMGVALDEVAVVARGPSTRKLKGGPLNAEVITSAELARAACCNLGESFTTNPSVDVSYDDAATGARQIKLLGLSGAYVQTLTENIPNFRGAASPFGLGYIAGPWISSIQVSKGTSSVKNGYEAITGQVNVELKKPQADREVALSLNGTSMTQADFNANANLWLGRGVSTAVLAHVEERFRSHDGNGDGFADMPRVRQVALMNRWAWLGTSHASQLAAKFIDERRRGGQNAHGHGAAHADPWLIDITTRRWEVFAKNAWIFNRETDGNIAAITSLTHHDQNSAYGRRLYDVLQTNAYISLMFENKWGGGVHALSAGYSLNYDHFRQMADIGPAPGAATWRDDEAVNGAYGQYTFAPSRQLTLMAGLRFDYSSVYGPMLTPRFHLRWNWRPELSVHASAGRGYHSPHPLAENSYLLASSRAITFAQSMRLDDALNAGAGFTSTFYPAGRPLSVSAEYYLTYFRRQLLADLDADPFGATFVEGRSRSHSAQLEVTWSALRDLSLTAACRLTDVRADYGRGMTRRPLTSRWKGLVTASWSPMMGIWQLDLTCAVNGGGRMPEPAVAADGTLSWERCYPALATLNAQLTRNFRQWSVYVGGENLTGSRQRNPIVGADAPGAPGFDATMVYGPTHGAVVYVGVRFRWVRY